MAGRDHVCKLLVCVHARSTTRYMELIGKQCHPAISLFLRLQAFPLNSTSPCPGWKTTFCWEFPFLKEVDTKTNSGQDLAIALVKDKWENKLQFLDQRLLFQFLNHRSKVSDQANSRFELQRLTGNVSSDLNLMKWCGRGSSGEWLK